MGGHHVGLGAGPAAGRSAVPAVVRDFPAHVKLLATFVFAAAVVATPVGLWWPFAVHAGVIAAAATACRVPPRAVATGLLVEVPFVVFALLLPVVALGPRTQVGPFSVSEPGLAAGATLLARATLGVLAATILAATTSPRQLVAGLERLRLPTLLTQILGFMIRYLDVVADDVRRMRVALASRGFRARSPRQWRILGRAVGALFIRSYERGERVHLAMLSRGYTGSMPPSPVAKVTWAQWVVGGIGPVVAVAATLVGRMTT